MTTVYASIGNSDAKLSQLQWHGFHSRFVNRIRQHASRIYGDWVSPSTDPWQNACIAFEVDPERAQRLKADLAELAPEFFQDSIAWAEAAPSSWGRPMAPDAPSPLGSDRLAEIRDALAAVTTNKPESYAKRDDANAHWFAHSKQYAGELAEEVERLLTFLGVLTDLAENLHGNVVSKLNWDAQECAPPQTQEQWEQLADQVVRLDEEFSRAFYSALHDAGYPEGAPEPVVSPTDPAEFGPWLRAQSNGTILRTTLGTPCQIGFGYCVGGADDPEHEGYDFGALLLVGSDYPFDLGDGNELAKLTEYAPFTVLHRPDGA
jgi:hypothetical protein